MSETATRKVTTGGLLLVVRYVLPVGVVLAGVLSFLLAPSSSRFEGAAACVGGGLSILLLNVLYREGVRGDAEAQARDFYDDHGYWPDGSETGSAVSSLSATSRPRSVCRAR
jgi:hypothetical protein